MNNQDNDSKTPGAIPGPAVHGGQLKERLADADTAANWTEKASSLPSLTLTPRQTADMECLAVGAFSPLEGFMNERDYRSVVSDMRLASGLAWSLPITLAVTDEQAADIKGASDVALNAPDGGTLAILHLEEIYTYDREEEASKVFRTTDEAHPGVGALMSQGDLLAGGKITVLKRPESKFADYRLTPMQIREKAAERGWNKVVGFQTRNPIHRAHEYLTKCALEIVDGLLLHPLVGETKGDDIPADVRMKAYHALMKDYYPQDRVLLSVFPAAMRYAGPREAVFHAICRQNYGCTHFIVGRDHAGVGSYYGTFDAHRIFEEFSPGELGITCLFFDHSFWCTKCGQMATIKTCPHPPEDRVALSGTEVRKRLVEGGDLPPEFSRAEVANVLKEAQ